MPKYAGHPIMHAIYDSLKKIVNKKEELLVRDFDKRVLPLGWQRRHQTLSWMHDINREIATFRSFSQTGMSVHSPFSEVFKRIKRVIKALESGLQDEYLNPKQVAIFNEVKDELEACVLILEFGEIKEEAM